MLTDFGITTPATTTSLRATEGSRGTACYNAPELLLEGKFNKKTDIWAMGCILYELCTGLKAFATDWATISYTRDPPSRSFTPFTHDLEPDNVMIAKINSLIDSMVQIDPQRRCSAPELCASVSHALRFREGDPPEPSSPTIFFEPSQLIGTEVPVRNGISPIAYDQMVSCTTQYSDFQWIRERREAIAKCREATYGSQHSLTIWAYLYLAYTQLFTMQTQAAFESLSLALLFNQGNSIDNKTLVAIMIAFGEVTLFSNAEVGYKMFKQLRTHGQIKLDVIEELKVDVGLLTAIASLHPSSNLRTGSPAFALDVIERLVRQENIGSEHALTMRARNALGWLYFVAGQGDMARKAYASALETAQRNYPPDSREVLFIEGMIAVVDVDVVANGRGDLLQPLMSMLKLLPRQVECFGTNNTTILGISDRIKHACLVLQNVAYQNQETQTALTIAHQLLSAYQL